MKTFGLSLVVLSTLAMAALSQRCTNTSIRGSPMLKVTSFPNKTTAGSDVNIVCAAVRPIGTKYSTPNPFEINFFKGQSHLKVPGCVDDPFEEAQKIKICVLSLKDVSETDSGTYFCQARNAWGCTYKSIKISVTESGCHVNRPNQGLSLCKKRASKRG